MTIRTGFEFMTGLIWRIFVFIAPYMAAWHTYDYLKSRHPSDGGMAVLWFCWFLAYEFKQVLETLEGEQDG